jgi:hypothetical protein
MGDMGVRLGERECFAERWIVISDEHVSAGRRWRRPMLDRWATAYMEQIAGRRQGRAQQD